MNDTEAIFNAFNDVRLKVLVTCLWAECDETIVLSKFTHLNVIPIYGIRDKGTFEYNAC